MRIELQETVILNKIENMGRASETIRRAAMDIDEGRQRRETIAVFGMHLLSCIDWIERDKWAVKETTENPIVGRASTQIKYRLEN